MKTRVITAVVAIGLFIPVLFFLPTWVLTLVCGALMAVGASFYIFPAPPLSRCL